jgi:hypothetical protein
LRIALSSSLGVTSAASMPIAARASGESAIVFAERG